MQEINYKFKIEESIEVPIMNMKEILKSRAASRIYIYYEEHDQDQVMLHEIHL